MIGAIIGDLAAWTYEHDRTRFWSHLVSEEAKVSEFGLSVLTTAALINTNPQMPREEGLRFTQQAFRNFSTASVEMSPGAMQWTASFICGYQSQLFGIALLRMATCAFFEVADKEMYFDSNWEKEEGYTRMFLNQMISLLRRVVNCFKNKT